MSNVTWSSRESIAALLGSISIVFWIFVLFPQILLNYKKKSTQGISTIFFALWLIGDVTNLIGSILQNLLPTVIFLAVYCVFTDLVLGSQFIYYNKIFKKQKPRHASRSSKDSFSNYKINSDLENKLLNEVEEPSTFQKKKKKNYIFKLKKKLDNKIKSSRKNKVFFFVVLIFVVIIIGIISWYLTYILNPKKPTNVDKNFESNLTAQIFGWISASVYLGSRLPQIYLNYKKKSVDGLSLLLFIFSFLGNLAFSSSIFIFNSSTKYLNANISWLVGSLGTIIFDVILWVQFFFYQKKSSNS